MVKRVIIKQTKKAVNYLALRTIKHVANRTIVPAFAEIADQTITPVIDRFCKETGIPFALEIWDKVTGRRNGLEIERLPQTGNIIAVDGIRKEA